MNTSQNVYTFSPLEDEVPVKKSNLNKLSEKKYNVSCIIKDNDTFDIEFFESQDEKEILEEWMNKIGKSICIEDVGLEVDEELKRCIENEFERNLPISQYVKEELNKIFQEIIQLCNLRKNINKYKLKYSKNTADIAKKYKGCPAPSIFRSDPNDIAKTGLKNPAQDITRTCIKEELVCNYDIIEFPLFNYLYINNTIIVLHEESLMTFVIKEPAIEYYNIVKNKRFGFALKFEANNDDTLNSIMNKLFNEKCFESLAELDKEIETMQVLINKNAADIKGDREKKQVKKFINDNYIVNSYVGDKMKASDLCTLIEENFQILGIELGNIIAFRNRLAKYLLDIGLQKKRFGDGFYYYGLRKFNDLKHDYAIKKWMEENGLKN